MSLFLFYMSLMSLYHKQQFKNENLCNVSNFFHLNELLLCSSKSVVLYKILQEIWEQWETSAIYSSRSQPTTTVSFLMLARHFLFTFLILNFLCILQAQYKVYRTNKEIYRNSAIPHLQRWNNKRNIGHMQQMWDSLSYILQKIKVQDRFYRGF